MRIRQFFAALSVCCVLAVAAPAQSTLFNIPSTDVVAPGRVYFEMDFLSHCESHDEGGFQAYAPRVVVGVADRIEAGANVLFVDVSADNQPVEFQPNVKFKLYDGGDNGTAICAGAILYTPLSHRTGVDTFGLLYTNISKKIPGDYGPRVTAGAYGLVGREDGLGTKGGAIVGFEQPLHKRVAIVADWMSGYNRFGYVTPGLGFTLPKNQIVYAGYSVGNQGRKNNSLFLYYGVTF